MNTHSDNHPLANLWLISMPYCFQNRFVCTFSFCAGRGWISPNSVALSSLLNSLMAKPIIIQDLWQPAWEDVRDDDRKDACL